MAEGQVRALERQQETGVDAGVPSLCELAALDARMGAVRERAGAFLKDCEKTGGRCGAFAKRGCDVG
jgi:hypothetical protein